MLTALLSLYLGSRFCAPNGPDELPAMPPEISFHPDWQIKNGIFNRPIMVRIQVRVHRWGPEQEFRHSFICGSGLHW